MDQSLDKKIREIVERFWNDVASLPWHELEGQWEAPTETKKHFVDATIADLLAVVDGTKQTPTQSEPPA